MIRHKMSGLKNKCIDTEIRERVQKLHNEEFHNLCSSPDISSGTKSYVMRLTDHVARMGEMRYAYQNLFEYLKGKDHFGILS
jgi:hypothetical protein